MNKTLYCAISAHGFGHVAQMAPILNRLHALRGDLHIVIQCDAPYKWLQQSFHFPFQHVAVAMDFGMIMRDALRVDVVASHQRYVKQHLDWHRRVDEAAELISTYDPAMIFSNVAYLPTAAAAQLGVPAINLCSLNWFTIYRYYCESMSGATRILDDMLQAYNAADVFLAPQPSMAMPEITRLKSIGTIARIGNKRAAEIREQAGLSGPVQLVLISHGGVGLVLDYQQWTQDAKIHYLVAAKDLPRRDDFSAYESLSMPYIDICCSCDTIVSKSGYGSYAEAACNGISMLYTRRPNWPEDPYLVDWLQQHAHCHELTIDELRSGDLHEQMALLQTLPRPPKLNPVGIDQTVQVILQYYAQDSRGQYV